MPARMNRNENSIEKRTLLLPALDGKSTYGRPSFAASLFQETSEHARSLQTRKTCNIVTCNIVDRNKNALRTLFRELAEPQSFAQTARRKRYSIMIATTLDVMHSNAIFYFPYWSILMYFAWISNLTRFHRRPPVYETELKFKTAFPP